MDLYLSALQQSISDLEKSIHSLEIWLIVMTGLVVLGLVVEYLHELPEAVAQIREAGRWLWKPSCVILGAFLIVAGVAGEFIVEFKASHKETDLRNANDAVYAGLNHEAGQARIDASAAIGRASDADERAALDEKEAARLNRLAETERLERIKIEENAAWRRFPKEARTELASRLELFEGETARISYNVGDVEASNFGTDLGLALQTAKWIPDEPLAVLKMREGPVPVGTNPPLETGITVQSTGDQNSLNAADALVDQLVALGFDSTRSAAIVPNSDPAVFVFVEPRPEGPQGEAKFRKGK